MKKPKDAKAAAAKDSEEAFLTLLQRIQRQAQTTTTTAARNTLVVPAIAQRPRRPERPPEAAATAMGRQLALKFQALGVVVEPEEEPMEKRTDGPDQIKQCQEHDPFSNKAGGGVL